MHLSTLNRLDDTFDSGGWCIVLQEARARQDDSDFFSSQGSINSLDDEIVRKECLSALERSGIPLSQAPPAWPSNSTSAPAALALQTAHRDSSTTDMLVSAEHPMSQ